MNKKRHYKIIESSMVSRLQALRVLDKHGLYAEFYQVPEGEDYELAEAMKLLGGLGFVIKNKTDDSIIGKFFEAEPIHGGNAKSEDKEIDSIIPVHFQKTSDSKFSFKKAISKLSKL